MERRRKMDLAGLARTRCTLTRFAAFFIFVCSASYFMGQASSDLDPVQKAKQLAAKEQWQEVVSLSESISTRSPELNYLYGTALARLALWPAVSASTRRRPMSRWP